jgi:hypothetical protein
LRKGTNDLRVLITGMTSLQVGRPGKYGMCTFANLLPVALRAAGHEVDQRSVTPGEPLDGYDAILLGIHGPGSIGARNGYRYAALDVIARAEREGCKPGLFLDDWDLKRIDKDLRYLLGKRERLNSGMERERGYDWAEAHLDHLLGAVEMLRDEPWPTTLLPKFTWGDCQLLVDAVNGLTTANTVFLDPSALVPASTAPILHHRDRLEAWIVASVVDKGKRWADRASTRWPLRIRQTKVPESDVVAAYGVTAGALVWPNNHPGSGWWRNRYVFASRMGAVICASPQDVGDDFGLVPSEVEAMTPDQRQELAHRQRVALESVAWSREQLVYETDLALKRIASGG